MSSLCGRGGLSENGFSGRLKDGPTVKADIP